MEVDLRQYNCGPVKLSGDHNALYERHLLFDRATDPAAADARQRYEAFARAVRDVLSQRWVSTGKTYALRKPKRVYYLSMEFLIGRSLANNIMNLGLDAAVRRACAEKGLEWPELAEEEPDAGLGNGGLGRLAACFMESLASLEIPAMGYGLRYEYGIFRQSLRDGWQAESPDNWLRHADPWEVSRPGSAVEVRFPCSFEIIDCEIKLVPGRPSSFLAIPYDRPVVGYGGKTINTLRLWAAAAPNELDFQLFSKGEFAGAVAEQLAAESFTRVLYPDDSTDRGRGLRLFQEYFLVAASLGDLVRRFRLEGHEWSALPEKAAIQLNDTHPALAVPELMRILLDEAGLGWETAWDITRNTLAYTNHTLLPEALEKWPVSWLQITLPRHLEILREIDRRFLDDVRIRFPGDRDRIPRMSLFEEGAGEGMARMAHVAIVGSHSTNGVAAIHSELVRTKLVRDFAEMYPERFNNMTNGVTPRRWLRLANPELSAAITQAIGDGWVKDLDELAKLRPLAGDAAFREACAQAKRARKLALCDWLRARTGAAVDPDSIFDSQIKRIHEYKRQLLNILHIVILYDRLRRNPTVIGPPRTIFFAGKAAPAYRFAKLVIKLINNVAGTIDGDPEVRGKLKVLFLPDYSVSLAEHLIPASDVSEQISTAGYEASGTGNMKFMMNGALTIGTRDGATIEMAEEAGEENMFLFGLTAEQVAASRGWYNPCWHYENEPETRMALDLIRSNYFSRNEPGVFQPVLDALLVQGDHYRHLADLTAYAEAHARLAGTYLDRDAWTRMSVLNVAASGKFSSDRTIRQYAQEIWGAVSCPTDATTIALA
jgi:starch phosphorylase